MSKKKPAEANADNSAPEAASEVPSEMAVGPPAERRERSSGDSQEVAEPTATLISEVQSFLERREELSRKLAEEILATEKRLADLRRTAGLLQVEGTADPARDRKPKKAKPKAAPRPEKRESVPAAGVEGMPSPADNAD